VRISAVNTLLTALYLGVLLPILGVSLPLVKTLIVLTFLAGLLPVVMESAFGMAGLIAAPIYYAYLKDELASRGLI
jgi:predicted PurR-regulated permease PerM